VSASAPLARAIDAAFGAPRESLAVDALLVDLARGLLAAAGTAVSSSRRVDVAAMARARQLLHAAGTRVVHSRELEGITGLSRYDVARQFRVLYGTSPHRYALLRRLDVARDKLRRGRPLAEIAADTGFADQAHFTRAFRAAFGLTPARYRALDSRAPAAPRAGPPVSAR
jgi:AraC-like DNA-binding protein